ncbi:single-strand DNA-binding protein [Sedimentibacter acidaminivorans]|uniref:Single-stranded DNA-binding protein n=1 Tax=Sedimentibacter acidaminivorans TaxID=913099 RepID=A0ABS4GHK6_9FIRM|nr:single-stranded DNA-binding protein [Sedimentibacter acidaminivorans]MBP1926865.1 single-strand DNA-binding protein [Sedimentibacter acidaminivorans]
MNHVVLIGRLVRDPELKFIPTTGMAVTNFTLAVDKDLFGDKKQEAVNQGKPTANFIYITVFGKSAENCANYLNKGNKCAVHGRITTSSYEKDGAKQYKTGVTADRVEFLEGKKNDSDVDNDIFTPIGDDEEIPF